MTQYTKYLGIRWSRRQVNWKPKIWRIEKYFTGPEKYIVYVYWFNGWKPVRCDTFGDFLNKVKGLTYNEEMHDLTFMIGDTHQFLDRCGHSTVYRFRRIDREEPKDFVLEQEMCNGWDRTHLQPKTLEEVEELLSNWGVVTKLPVTIEDNEYYLVESDTKSRLLRINRYLK